MYLEHWRLLCRPFDERLEPNLFFSSAHHQGMLLKLFGIVEQRESIAILAGGAGYGKSTVVTKLADSLSAETHRVIYLHSTPATAADVFHGMIEELVRGEPTGSAAAATTPSARWAEALKTQLGRRVPARHHLVVVLDDADLLPEHELHCLIRRLHELKDESSAAMTALLVGSAELLVRARRLLARGDEPVSQCMLGAMAPADTAAYISHRLRLAGGDSTVFAPSAVQMIHNLSGGVPRRINRLCDLSLLMGYANDCDQIDESLLWIAQREIRVLAPTRTATVPATRRWRSMVRQPSSAMTQ